MNDFISLENVIAALEACSYIDDFDCSKCYLGGPGFGFACRDQLMRDALAMLKAHLALLKAQEPRVLTLEEALGEDECWIEGRSGACGYGDALISDDGERVDFYRSHSIDTLDFYAYNVVWRCWTARPTDEQRKATPWEQAL